MRVLQSLDDVKLEARTRDSAFQPKIQYNHAAYKQYYARFNIDFSTKIISLQHNVMYYMQFCKYS